MLSVLLSKSRVRADSHSGYRHTQPETATHRDSRIQGQRDSQDSEAQVQTHTVDRVGKHREHEVNKSNLNLLLVKQLQEKVLSFP